MESENSFEDKLNQYKIPLVIGLIGVTLLIGGIISSGIIPKTFVKSSKQYSSSGQVSGIKSEIKVDVSGEVATPGVYSLPDGSRIEDALRMAGGLTDAADPDFVSRTINLAQKLSDGMKIYIPSASEEPLSAAAGGQSGTVGDALVNINEATLAELDKLPGVGEVTAQKIIDNRPYSGIEELVSKKAVSRSVYEKIKAQISTW